MSALWRVHLHHFLHNTQESTPVHKDSRMTDPPTPAPAPQTIVLILEILSRFGVLDVGLELGPLNVCVGRTRWLE